MLDPRLVELLHVNPVDERAAWDLFKRRQDKSYSFTDCTSFVVMRRQRLERAITLDTRFSQEGFVMLPE